MGIKGNEIADSLEAKEAIEEEESKNIEIPFQDYIKIFKKEKYGMQHKIK